MIPTPVLVMTNKLLSLYIYLPAIIPSLPSHPTAARPGCQNLTQAGKLEQAGLEAAGKLEYRGPGCLAPWAAHPPASWRKLDRRIIIME